MEIRNLYSHITLLYAELYDVYIAYDIYNTVEQEWDSRIYSGNFPEEYPIRTILLEALNYRIFLGLSKIFSTSKDEFSLIKATNQIEQLIPNNNAVKEIIKNIHKKHESSTMVGQVKYFRDTFFAHLDKKSVNLRIRYDASATMTYITSEEINEWITLISKLIETAFGGVPMINADFPTKESIVQAFFED